MISRFFIDRPIFAAVLSIVITLAGGVAAFTLPLAQFPQITPPTVQVSCQYPGASAREVAAAVAAPIEQQVNGVENMLYMSSQCTNDGNYSLTVTFRHGVDLNMAQVMVQNRVALAMPSMPDVIKQTGVTTRKRSPDILCGYALISPDGRYDQLYLSNYALMQIRDELLRVEGVSDVFIFGQRDYSMRVWLDPDQLAARSLTAGDVARAIRDQNAPAPAGSVAGRQLQIPLSTTGRLSEPTQFEDILLRANPDGRIVRLKDVARVELGAKSQDVSTRLDGQETVFLAVFQMPDANALDVYDRVNDKIAELRKDFPEGLDCVIGFDTTPYTRESIHEVVKTLRDAIALVAVVVLLFLQNWRSAVIPLVAVPVAIIGTFAVMALMGFSLNNLTLFGLVLAIGIVVDDAIVVVEAVEHHIENGLSPRDATIKAMEQVSGPVIAVGLVLSAVFVPCAFISGITGQFFRQFALTIAVSTIISAFNSLTLSPALTALLLRPVDKERTAAPLPRLAFALGGGWLGWEFLAAHLAAWLARWGLSLPGWAAPAAAVAAGAVAGYLVGGGLNRLLALFFRGFNRTFAWGTRRYTGAVSSILKERAPLPRVGLVLAGACWGWVVLMPQLVGWMPPRLLAALPWWTVPAVGLLAGALVGWLAGRAGRLLPVALALAGEWAGWKLLVPALAVWLPKQAARPWAAPAAAFAGAVAGGVAGLLLVGLLVQVGRRLGRVTAWRPRLRVGSLRVSALVLAVYGGLLLFTWSDFQATPRGFIPSQDMGYLMIAVQLPDSASKERTTEVMTEMERIALDTPGVMHATGIIGQSFVLSAYGSNFGSMFINLKEYAKRTGPHESSEAIAAHLRKEFGKIKGAMIAVFGPPPVRGVGTAGGFKIMIEDRGGDLPPEVLQEQVDNLVRKTYGVQIDPSGKVVSAREAAALNKQGVPTRGLVGVFSMFRANVPQIQIDPDKRECSAKGIDMGAFADTLRIFEGSLYVNDFNKFGRTWQVIIQAESKFRDRIEDIPRLKVRNKRGAMVPLGSVASIREVNGPLVLTRYNMYPAASINGGTGPGMSSGEANALMQKLARAELPPAMSYEWTEMSYLELMAGNTAMIIFACSVVMVFLVLAAQYESWSLPLAIILVVPMCLLSALVGVNLAKMDINIFTQVGFVVLVGLASKNAILIVEFARQQRHAGFKRYEAVLEACKLRLRPILMTSFAFILGVVPLLVSHGAGAEMRHTLGTAVFSGMLGVTLFGIFLTPVFFYVIDWLGETRLFSSRLVVWAGGFPLAVLTLKPLRQAAGGQLRRYTIGVRQTSRPAGEAVEKK